MAVLGPGDMLGDRYRLDTFVATGGMGQVWRATDVVLSRTVAVKVLLPQLLTDPGFEARFRAEARIIAALRHPGVVNVYDYGEGADDAGRRVLYLVMAFVEGESLSEKLERAGRLSVAETMSVVAQAAGALQAAHDGGIVHRDVKPGNLLVQDDGTVTLVDFGVARATSVTSVTTGNAVPGTALYMAPEQASGQQVTGATDIYALGAVAYHCLAGYPPFNGTNPIEIALRHLQDEPPPLPDDVPPDAQQFVLQAMAKDPAARFESGAAMAAAARSVMRAAGTAGTTIVIPPAIDDGSARTTHVAAAAVAAPRTGAYGPGSAAGYGASGTTAHDLRPVTPEAEPWPETGGRSTGRRTGTLIGAAAAVLLVAGALVLLFAVAPDDGATPPANGSTASNAPASNGPAQTTTRQHTTTTRGPSTGPSQGATTGGPTGGPTTGGPTGGTTTQAPPPTTSGPTDGPTGPASPPANGNTGPTNPAVGPSH